MEVDPQNRDNSGVIVEDLNAAFAEDELPEVKEAFLERKRVAFSDLEVLISEVDLEATLESIRPKVSELEEEISMDIAVPKEERVEADHEEAVIEEMDMKDIVHDAELDKKEDEDEEMNGNLPSPTIITITDPHTNPKILPYPAKSAETCFGSYASAIFNFFAIHELTNELQWVSPIWRAKVKTYLETSEYVHVDFYSQELYDLVERFLPKRTQMAEIFSFTLRSAPVKFFNLFDPLISASHIRKISLNLDVRLLSTMPPCLRDAFNSGRLKSLTCFRYSSRDPHTDKWLPVLVNCLTDVKNLQVFCLVFTKVFRTHSLSSKITTILHHSETTLEEFRLDVGVSDPKLVEAIRRVAKQAPLKFLKIPLLLNRKVLESSTKLRYYHISSEYSTNQRCIDLTYTEEDPASKEESLETSLQRFGDMLDLAEVLTMNCNYLKVLSGFKAPGNVPVTDERVERVMKLLASSKSLRRIDFILPWGLMIRVLREIKKRGVFESPLYPLASVGYFDLRQLFSLDFYNVMLQNKWVDITFDRTYSLRMTHAQFKELTSEFEGLITVKVLAIQFDMNKQPANSDLEKGLTETLTLLTTSMSKNPQGIQLGHLRLRGRCSPESDLAVALLELLKSIKSCPRLSFVQFDVTASHLSSLTECQDLKELEFSGLWIPELLDLMQGKQLTTFMARSVTMTVAHLQTLSVVLNEMWRYYQRFYLEFSLVEESTQANCPQILNSLTNILNSLNKSKNLRELRVKNMNFTALVKSLKKVKNFEDLTPVTTTYMRKFIELSLNPNLVSLEIDLVEFEEHILEILDINRQRALKGYRPLVGETFKIHQEPSSDMPEIEKITLTFSDQRGSPLDIFSNVWSTLMQKRFRKLTIIGGEQVVCKTAEGLVEFCQNLKVLELKNVRLHATKKHNILTHFSKAPKLEELSLNSCALFQVGSDPNLERSMSQARCLKKLTMNIPHDVPLPSQKVEAFLKIPNLEWLELNVHRNIVELFQTMTPHIWKCKNLRYLIVPIPDYYHIPKIATLRATGSTLVDHKNFIPHLTDNSDENRNLLRLARNLKSPIQLMTYLAFLQRNPETTKHIDIECQNRSTIPYLLTEVFGMLGHRDKIDLLRLEIPSDFLSRCISNVLTLTTPWNSSTVIEIVASTLISDNGSNFVENHLVEQINTIKKRIKSFQVLDRNGTSLLPLDSATTQLVLGSLPDPRLVRPTAHGSRRQINPQTIDNSTATTNVAINHPHGHQSQLRYQQQQHRQPNLGTRTAFTPNQRNPMLYQNQQGMQAAANGNNPQMMSNPSMSQSMVSASVNQGVSQEMTQGGYPQGLSQGVVANQGHFGQDINPGFHHQIVASSGLNAGDQGCSQGISQAGNAHIMQDMNGNTISQGVTLQTNTAAGGQMLQEQGQSMLGNGGQPTFQGPFGNQNGGFQQQHQFQNPNVGNQQVISTTTTFNQGQNFDQGGYQNVSTVSYPNGGAEVNRGQIGGGGYIPDASHQIIQRPTTTFVCVNQNYPVNNTIFPGSGISLGQTFDQQAGTQLHMGGRIVHQVQPGLSHIQTDAQGRVYSQTPGSVQMGTPLGHNGNPGTADPGSTGTAIVNPTEMANQTQVVSGQNVVGQNVGLNSQLSNQNFSSWMTSSASSPSGLSFNQNIQTVAVGNENIAGPDLNSQGSLGMNESGIMRSASMVSQTNEGNQPSVGNSGTLTHVSVGYVSPTSFPLTSGNAGPENSSLNTAGNGQHETFSQSSGNSLTKSDSMPVFRVTTTERTVATAGVVDTPNPSNVNHLQNQALNVPQGNELTIVQEITPKTSTMAVTNSTSDNTLGVNNGVSSNCIDSSRNPANGDVNPQT